MDDFLAEFVNESREMLLALECELVAWERDPDDRARLDAIFRFVHTVKGNCGFFDLPRIEALAHAAEDALSEVRAGKRQPDTRLVDAVLAVIDRIAEMVEAVESGAEVSRGDDPALIAALAGTDAATDPEAQALGPGQDEGLANAALRQVESLRTVRLPTNLVDRFMSGISDMILVRNELERQIRELGQGSSVEATFNRLSAILSDTQAAMTRVRMQPINSLFVSYQRLIRDLSAELGKQVEVDIESGEVELDREMIELLRDPLLHIVRNAIDHGIENPEERIAAGKRAAGQLRLTARQTGNEIRIAIIDDGRGIDGDRLVEKALARGLLSREQAGQLSLAQRNALICEAGLSTADAVTNISGRGVGMDVVRASIEKIGGKLGIESTPGNGCRFMLDVPLTLSIVPSLTVSAGAQTFALPRSYVREIVRGGEGVEAEKIGGMRHVTVRDSLHPCIGLGDVLAIEDAVPALQQTLVMVRMIDGSVFALGVDQIVDNGDLVIRPVAAQIIGTGLYVGVAQLSDGRPALMLDVAGIARQAGLNAELHGRARIDEEALQRDAAAEGLVPVIVFAGQDGIRKAVAIEAVDRLAEVEASAVSLGGGALHVVFDGAILPLLGLVGDPAREGCLDILILRDESCRIAFATAGKVDAAELDPATVTGEAGRKLALVDGQSVELLELACFGADSDHSFAAFSAPTCRLPLDDPWSNDFLRPMVEAAGYAVIEGAEGQVDLEVQIEIDPATGQAGAGEIVLLREAATGRSQTFSRDDRAALAKALRSASQGRQ